MENYLRDMLLVLQEQNVEIRALVHRHKFGTTSDPFIDEIPCFGQWLYAPVSPSFPLKLVSMISEFKPDILHMHLPNTSALWVLAIPAARKIPWVVHWHADVGVKSGSLLKLAYRAYKPFEQRVLSRSRRIIATSPPYLASSTALIPWKSKSVSIPLGRAPNGFPAISKQAMTKAHKQWGGFEKRVLVVARMTYYKGLEYLIQAVQQTSSVRLVVVGPDTEKKLAHQIKDNRIAKKIWLAGTQPEEQLHALMATCDCLCLPSIDRCEAFGLTLLEAMYHGKPVIASNIHGSGISWVVDDGVTGKLVPPKNVQLLSEALESVNPKSPEWIRMGKQAKKKFAAHFDLAQSARDIVRHYESILIENI